MDRYERRANGGLKTRDKKLKSLLKRQEAQQRDAAEQAANLEALHTEKAGFLEPENEMEKTFKVTQKDVLDAVDEATRAKKSSSIWAVSWVRTFLNIPKLVTICF